MTVEKQVRVALIDCWIDIAPDDSLLIKLQ